MFFGINPGFLQFRVAVIKQQFNMSHDCLNCCDYQGVIRVADAEVNLFIGRKLYVSLCVQHRL